MIAPGAMAFNSWRVPNSHAYSVPRILVTLLSFGHLDSVPPVSRLVIVRIFGNLLLTVGCEQSLRAAEATHQPASFPLHCGGPSFTLTK